MPSPTLPSENTRRGKLPHPNEDSTETNWWDSAVHQPFAKGTTPILISLDQLLVSALTYSAQIRVIQDAPLIRETAIVEANAEFDWSAFVESQFIDTSTPVGNQLETGGPLRFREHNFATSAGIRRKNKSGGRFDIAQEIGFRNNNSIFFTPPNQGNSRLTISYTQPLLQGAGRVYNTSLTVLAQIDAATSQDDFSSQLQSHLLEINRAYWELYLQRANLLQKQRLRNAAQKILTEMERRRNIDALQSQILRAQATVASRRAEVFRAEMAIRNSESRIRALVNDPSLGNTTENELVPNSPPPPYSAPLDIQRSVEIAFHNRPELAASIKQVRAAAVRLNMSRNELLPLLNLVVDTYVSGLRGNANIGGSLLDQYSRGEPSYSVGLQYEMPINNRRAKARYDRRRLEVRQLESQLQVTMEALRFEVEAAVREVITSHRELRANAQAVAGEEAEVRYLYDRWKVLPGHDRSASILLEDLLDAQERLNVAEFAFLNSQLDYNTSHMAYQRALGTMLQTEHITMERYIENCLPQVELHRDAAFRIEKPDQAKQDRSEPSAYDRDSTVSTRLRAKAPLRKQRR
ncbi:MAG: TolC family protein [Planctomycetaceae bacterium]|nr:TolC family protein [Planctomycetaceae bacterium]